MQNAYTVQFAAYWQDLKSFLHFSNTMLVFSTVLAVFMVKPEEWTTNIILHFVGSCLGYFGILIGLFHKLQLEGSGLAQGTAVNIAFIFTFGGLIAANVLQAFLPALMPCATYIPPQLEYRYGFVGYVCGQHKCDEDAIRMLQGLDDT